MFVVASVEGYLKFGLVVGATHVETGHVCGLEVNVCEAVFILHNTIFALIRILISLRRSFHSISILLLNR